jgi:hypothetical protein
MVNGQWSMVNGQKSMVNGQWSMVNGQWSIDIGVKMNYALPETFVETRYIASLHCFSEMSNGHLTIDS